ncbi:MAG: thioredoxin domain-containing protein [Sulfurovaceae bacterium]|nr:thioredoxin domain-containing protein [Sulfurovaceae bacterium]
MSLMSKLLSTTLVATLSLSASSNEGVVKNYIEKHMVKASSVKVTSVDIIGKKELDSPKGWDAYFVNIHAQIKKSPTVTDKVTVPETIFAKDGFASPTLINMKTGKDLKAMLKPELKSDIYNDKHLFVGNKDAKHKIVIFSDPKCPFCQKKVPEIYKAVKANPETFALYYYHFPLLRIHPVSDILTRVMLIEQKKGHFDNAMKVYTLNVKYSERNVTKVLAEVKKVMGISLTEKDLDAKEIADEIKADQNIATKALISGTPTIYIDGKWDRSRNKYKEFISYKSSNSKK